MPSELDLIVAKCNTLLAQCLVAANEAATAAASIGAAGLAPLNSPIFVGTPEAPTPPVGDSSTRIATTAFLAGLLGQPSGIATLDNTGVVPISQLPFAGLTVDGTWNAATNNPTLISGVGTSGHFRVVTVAGTTTLNGISSWAVGDWAMFSSGVWTKVPYVAPPISNLPLSSLEGIGGGTFVGNTAAGSASPSAISIASIIGYLAVVTTGGSGLCPTLPGGTGTFLRGDGTYAVPPAANLAGYAPLASPAFTGTATVATQARDLSSTAIASTQFVIQQQASAAELALIKINGTASAGTSTYAAKADHIHGTDTSRAAATNPQTSGAWTHGGSGSVSGTLTASVLAANVLLSALSGTITNTLTVGGTLTVKNATVSGTLTPTSLSGSVVAEGNLNLSDVTTNDATTGRHGLLPKLSNSATQFLNGTGGWSTPAAGLQTASQGLTVSGSDVRMNTNNALGIGSFIFAVSSASPAPGATVSTNGSNLKCITMNVGAAPGGNVVTTTGSLNISAGQVWRNMSGIDLDGSTCGLFQRVS